MHGTIDKKKIYPRTATATRYGDSRGHVAPVREGNPKTGRNYNSYFVYCAFSCLYIMFVIIYYPVMRLKVFL